MVRPWMLSETTKVCERTETATKKRRIARQNDAAKKQQNLEFRSGKEQNRNASKNQHNSENEQTQQRRNAQKLEENARCRPKLRNRKNENRPQKGFRAAGQPAGENNDASVAFVQSLALNDSKGAQACLHAETGHLLKTRRETSPSLSLSGSVPLRPSP